VGVHLRAGWGGRARAIVLVLGTALALPWAAAAEGTEAAAAGEPQAPEPRSVATAVVPPQTDAALEPLRLGLREWLRERLAAAGLPTADRARVDRALADLAAAGHPVLHGADAPALAQRTGAGRVLLSELWLDAGEVELRFHLHAGTDGAVQAGTRAHGRLAELPQLAQAALGELVQGLGLDGRRIAADTAPRLSDWSTLGRARLRLEAGDFAGAWRELARATGPTADALRSEIDARSAAPDVPPAARSRLANASGRPDGDWLRVREALRGPPDPDTLLAAADAAMARAEPDTAERLYERVTQLAPRSGAALLGRAAALREAGRTEEAAEVLRAAAAAQPGNPEPEEALAALESLPAEEQARHRLRAGALQVQRFETEAARESFEEAARRDPGQGAAAARQVARLEERLGQQAEALLAYEQAAEQGPRDAELLVGLARARAANQDADGAAAAYREALERDPQLTGALAGLGELLAERGQDAEAAQRLARAVALDPSDVRARRGLARVKLRGGAPEEALRLLEGPELPALPPRDRAGLLEDAAGVRKQTGDLAGAERTLEAAVALEPDDPPLRTALADLYRAAGQAERAQRELEVATRLGAARAIEIDQPAGPQGAPSPEGGAGDPAGSSYATFDALVGSFPVESPGRGAPLGRVLLLGSTEELDTAGTLRRWLLPRRPDLEAIDLALLRAAVERFPVDETPEIPRDVEGQVAALLAFSGDRETIATVNHVLGSDALFVARLRSERSPGERLFGPERSVLEVRLLGGDRSGDVFILANALRLEDLSPFLRWNPRAVIPWLLILGLLAYPVVRGWGSVVVKLDYDTKAARGFFQVRLSRRPSKVQAQRPKEGQSALKRFQQKSRWWSRFSRSLADAETRFRLVPARTWYVNVHGLLTDPRSKEVIGSYVEERQVQVERGQTLPLTFDLRPKEAPIEVRVVQGAETGEGPEVQAVAALRGRPDSLRYLRGGSALLTVPEGSYRVVVGCGDRVFEEEVSVQDLAGASVAFRLDRDEQALFTGCPEAVEPYVNGDLLAASQALDRSGQAKLANLIRAEYHRERGETEKAGRFYEAAGRVQEAAELAADGEDAQHSATLFAQAGDFGRAGERYRETGDFARAAEAYEAAFDYDAAIDCHRTAGNVVKALELLEKTGRYFEAGEAALELEDADRAIRNLQQVDLRDPDYAEACRVLAQMFADRGDPELAAQKLGEAVSASGDGAPLEMLEQLGDLLERAGQVDRALETFEAIRKRDYTYPGAAERAAALRQRRQQASGLTTRATAANEIPGAAAAPAESRYEILAEIGRGGMGVVYQARDRRLGRTVALKRLPDNLRENPTAVQLFLREARAAAALNHPNIVTLFDADQEDGNYYLTMEFLDGLPLDKILSKRGRLSARDCIRLGAQIATGLQFAHERRIVHRDIKTSNLFFTRDRVVKIMDFGLAKMVEEVRRAATVIGGTPYYMAPEQATGENVDHRADLYAFGVTLYELLTGAVPFREGDVTWHHRNTPPPDPRSAVSDLPDALAELVLQMMEKDPAGRPASAAEVGSRLAEIGRSLG
jgi:tetratricopeptide (TPR) repeat protein